jgi:hypothetical protein
VVAALGASPAGADPKTEYHQDYARKNPLRCSAGGPDEPWNRTTLCAFHHQRVVHTGLLRIRGRAPEALVFELGFGSFRSGDVRIA